MLQEAEWKLDFNHLFYLSHPTSSCVRPCEAASYRIWTRREQLRHFAVDMAANIPRVEFRPSPEVRERLELFRREQSERLGRVVTVSELVNAILEDFFEKTRLGRKKPDAS